MSDSTAFKLSCSVQNYAWGKIGLDSEVAKIHQANDKSAIDSLKPYAELWMGTHVKCPSKVHGSEKTLPEYINQNPECLGVKLRKQFPADGELPFLFKVLSVEKALSIQAHPNKVLAEKLHDEQPNIYLDPNHKPEMAIALTPFEVFIGFRPVQEILSFIKGIPELLEIVDSNSLQLLENAVTENDLSNSLKKCLYCIFSMNEESIKNKLSNMVQNISKSDYEDNYKVSQEIVELFLRIHNQYPGDVGCFVIFFMNYMKMQPGQAVFLAAGLPHAYISGDCIECMACSDNVIRAGLTPKLKDFELLISMLDYQTKPAESFLFSGEANPSDAYSTLFNPPIPDFSITLINIPDSVAAYELEILDSASIIIFIKGRGLFKTESEEFEIIPGSIVFISARTKTFLENISTSVCAYRAHCLL